MRDAVVFNSAAALMVAGACPSLTEVMELAGELLDKGLAAAKLEALAGFKP